MDHFSQYIRQQGTVGRESTLEVLEIWLREIKTNIAVLRAAGDDRLHAEYTEKHAVIEELITEVRVMQESN